MGNEIGGLDERAHRRIKLKEALRELTIGHPRTARQLFAADRFEPWAETAIEKLCEKGILLRRGRRKWQLVPDQNQSLMHYLMDDAALAGLFFEPDPDAVMAELEKALGAPKDPLEGMTPFERIVIENLAYIRAILDKHDKDPG